MYFRITSYNVCYTKLLRISGRYQEHVYEAPRKRHRFSQPPTQENKVVTLFDKTCKTLGIMPLVTPRAILSENRGHRKACYYSNFCGSYGCSSGAKGSSREALLFDALATGNLTLMSNTHVKYLQSNNKQVTSAVAVSYNFV